MICKKRLLMIIKNIQQEIALDIENIDRKGDFEPDLLIFLKIFEIKTSQIS